MVIKVLITDNRIVFTVEWETGKGEEDGSFSYLPDSGTLKTGAMYAYTQLLNMLSTAIVLWVQESSTATVLLSCFSQCRLCATP